MTTVTESTSSDFTQDLLRGSTDGLLLSLIEGLEEAHGYRLIRELESRSRGLLQFKEGTIYPALRKLESDGLIEGKWQALPTGRKRRLYVITGRGRQVLQRKIATWQQFTATVNLILNPNRV